MPFLAGPLSIASLALHRVPWPWPWCQQAAEAEPQNPAWGAQQELPPECLLGDANAVLQLRPCSVTARCHMQDLQSVFTEAWPSP